jgi:hypothetical protein
LSETIGICKLCLEEKPLQESHYIPAALYPKNATLEYLTPVASGIVEEHVTFPLLCWDCEQRFSRNGESDVLRYIAAKSKKNFPLQERMESAVALEKYSDIELYSGLDLGLDMDKFAYFMLSVVWRGAVHSWKKFDGTYTTPLPLGAFTEPVRQYLLGRSLLLDTAVIVIVCDDFTSRRHWFPPAANTEANCLNFRFPALGVFFRVVMGPRLPKCFRDYCCTSPRKCIFYGNAEKRTLEALDTLSRGKSL